MKFGLKLHHSGPGDSPAYMLRCTLEQVRRDLEALQVLGAPYVLLDPNGMVKPRCRPNTMRSPGAL